MSGNGVSSNAEPSAERRRVLDEDFSGTVTTPVNSGYDEDAPGTVFTLVDTGVDGLLPDPVADPATEQLLFNMEFLMAGVSLVTADAEVDARVSAPFPEAA